jgi:metal-sulfur cluster biosynthetic enzyme
MITKDEVKESLMAVVDPELGIDIVSLGLVRDVIFGKWDGDRYEHITVLMTLTSPLCPFADAILEEVEDTISILGFGQGRVELTFNPPWEATDELKMLLGL